MNLTDKIQVFNMDCMEYMAGLEDNFFDLAICDPEYGLDAGNYSNKPCTVRQTNGSVLKVSKPAYKKSDYDKRPVNPHVLVEIIRVSKKQIIWGGNYFGLSGGYLVWDKLNGRTDQYDAELAWISWSKEIRTVYYMWSGMFQGRTVSSKINKALYQIGDKSKNEKRIHPQQKPVKLYEYLLKNYATQGDRIIDTHSGSVSLAIACHNYGYEFVGLELDKEYYESAVKRFKEVTSQTKLFIPET